MSGNPFRRNVNDPSPDEVARADDRASSPPKGLAKKKRVVIQSPPRSPEEPPRRPSAGRISPPPPPLSALSLGETDSEFDSTAGDGLEQASLNTRRNSGSLPVPLVQPTGVNAPYNPFAKTLATSEASFGLEKARYDPREGIVHDAEAQGRSAGPRTARDIDAFKSMLMAGNAAFDSAQGKPSRRPPNLSGPFDPPATVRIHLFDHLLDAHPESPLTPSFDHPHEYSSADEEGDESSGLMGNTGERLDDFAPPAPPKPGQASASRVPQMVSFTDFDQSIPSARTGSPVRSPFDTSKGSGPRPPALNRTLSDLNKPLPAAPQATTAEQNPRPAPSSMTNDSPPQEKKAPPPPPTSRRAGQTSQAPARARSASNRSQESIIRDGTLHSKAGAPPPPPPSRKARSTQSLPSPTLETPSSGTPSLYATTETKTMPPPPAPRRQPAKAAGSLHRTLSNASHTSIPRVEAQASISQTTPPPAPPPRRGANANRDSLELAPNSMAWAARRTSGNERRSSGTSIDSERSAYLPRYQPALAEQELENTASTRSDGVGSKDILADMSAFQAEIDALRSQAARNG